MSCNSKRSPATSWLAGCQAIATGQDRWLSGFFDKGTWREVMAAWAAGVVVGRARLGGIPCGVITAETRSVTCCVPADPANLSTEARVFNQAGQVWYPDSAYKTAQAIEDMARERLPLFIFANWRGFSGGMKDMYDQVLKFGSMIIDAIRRYSEPVFVYLPPQSQLRGGAWVVVDPAINADMTEMYADPISCRAGVLEPEGTVEIKYRKDDLVKTMLRLDEKCRALNEEIQRLQESNEAFDCTDRIFQLQNALDSRQKELGPFYHQVACTFADLHDTPFRLQSRKLVHGLVPWAQSRSFFYARLRRRLLELRAIRLIDSALGQCSSEHDYTSTLQKEVDGSLQVDASNDVSQEHSGDSVDVICKAVPKLALFPSTNFARSLSHLRQWFIEDVTKSIPDVAEVVRVWDTEDIRVGTWLAEQLGLDVLLHIPKRTAHEAWSATTKPMKPCPWFQNKLDELRCSAVWKGLCNFLSSTPDSTDRLGSVLGSVLTTAQRDRLVHLLTASRPSQ